MERRFSILFLVACITAVFVRAPQVEAYNEETHGYITHESLLFYHEHFPERKVSPDLVRYVIEGARREDDNPRYMNHFYDPVYGRGLSNDARIDSLKVGYWPKSPDWALEKEDQVRPLYQLGAIAAPVATMLTAAEVKKLGLVPVDTDFTWHEALRAWVNGEREKAMYVLGHILHLIEDASVPDHTRNDPHPGDSPYEMWTKQFNFNNPDTEFKSRLSGKSPVALSSLQEHFNSMANYSNKNFFSKDTIAKPAVYPNPVSKLPMENINGEYYSVSIDEKLPLLYHYRFRGSLVLDPGVNGELKDPYNLVLSSYWSLLSTKAAQHVAGVINLFFEEAERAAKDPNFVRTRNKSFLVRASESVSKLFGSLGSAVEDALTGIKGTENTITLKEDAPLYTPISHDGQAVTNLPLMPLIEVPRESASEAPPTSGEVLGAAQVVLPVAGGFDAEFTDVPATPQDPKDTDDYAGLFLPTGGSATRPSAHAVSVAAPPAPPTSESPGAPQNLSLAWDGGLRELLATWNDAEDPDTPSSALVYELSVNGGSSTTASSGVRWATEPSTEYAIAVVAVDPEGNRSPSATRATTTPALPVEVTLFEITDTITDSGYWGSGEETRIGEIAVRYTPEATERVCAVHHKVRPFGAPGGVVLRLWESASPGGGDLLASATLAAASLPGTQEGYAEFRFAACVPLAAGVSHSFHFSPHAPMPGVGFISRFRPSDQFSNSSYWQKNPYTVMPVGWAEYPAREWSLKLVGYTE